MSLRALLHIIKMILLIIFQNCDIILDVSKWKKYS